eukprot:6182496-Prymnesium_polylepis.1
MTTPHYNITVAELLEYELRFEVAAYLNVKPNQLVEYKLLHPETTKKAARHVLMHICTQWCREHMLDRSGTHHSRGPH